MNTDLINWDEDLAVDSEEEYQAILNGLTRSQGFSLYFVQCSPFSSGKLIKRVQNDLIDKTISTLKFEHSIVDGNVFKRVNAFLQEHDSEVLFVQGLENSLAAAAETKKRLGWSWEKIEKLNWHDVPPVLNNLNQQRERFRDAFQTCFVFLLPQYALNYLIHRAPDFFDWRSGLFKYVADPKLLARESDRILTESDYAAYCSWSQEERDQRLLEIQSLLEISHADLADLHLEQGLIFAAYKAHDSAVLAYDSALAIQPDYPNALYNKGTSLSDLGRYEEAIAAYDAALEIEPDDHEALYNKGNALADLDRHEAAIAAYDAALAIKPDDHETWDNRGYSLAVAGHLDKAILSFDKAIEINPQHANALYKKAYALSKKGDLETAFSLLQQAFEIDPKYREMAQTDADFDSIRDDPQFQALLASSEALENQG